MTRFEYLSVLVSIVLALGISETIVCWVRLIQHRDEVKFSWLHGFWSLFSLYLMVQFWWGFWNFRLVEPWTILLLLNIVLETILVVVIAMLMTPGRNISPGLDLEAHYFNNARPMFLTAALMMALLARADIVILGIGLFSTENLVRYTGVLLVVILAFVKNRRLHYYAPPVSFALLALFSLVAAEL